MNARLLMDRTRRRRWWNRIFVEIAEIAVIAGIGRQKG